MNFISVSMYLAQKQWLRITIFMSPTGDGGVWHFTQSSEPLEGLAVCRGNAEPSFLNYFKNLSIGLAARIQPGTCRIRDKWFTDWASPSTEICNKSQDLFWLWKSIVTQFNHYPTFCFILF